MDAYFASEVTWPRIRIGAQPLTCVMTCVMRVWKVAMEVDWAAVEWHSELHPELLQNAFERVAPRGTHSAMVVVSDTQCTGSITRHTVHW